MTITSTATAVVVGAGATVTCCNHHHWNHHRIVSLARLSHINGTSSSALFNAQLPFLNHRKNKLSFIPGAADSTQPASQVVVNDDEFSLAKVLYIYPFLSTCHQCLLFIFNSNDYLTYNDNYVNQNKSANPYTLITKF